MQITTACAMITTVCTVIATATSIYFMLQLHTDIRSIETAIKHRLEEHPHRSQQ